MGQISALIVSSLHAFASVSNMSTSSEILEVLGLVMRVKNALCGSIPVVLWLSYSPLDSRFAGSNPAGVDGFFRA